MLRRDTFVTDMQCELFTDTFEYLLLMETVRPLISCSGGCQCPASVPVSQINQSDITSDRNSSCFREGGAYTRYRQGDRGGGDERVCVCAGEGQLFILYEVGRLHRITNQKTKGVGRTDNKLEFTSIGWSFDNNRTGVNDYCIYSLE